MELDNDMDVVRWGSEAHRVFGSDWIEDFYHESATQGPEMRSSAAKPSVRQLTYDMVQRICFSSQMLEEDAIELSQELARFTPEPEHLFNCTTLTTLGASIVASLGFYFPPWKTTVKIWMICSTLTVPLIYMTALYASRRRTKSCIGKFLRINGKIMSRMYSAFKKMNDYSTVHESKKRAFLTKNDPKLPQDYFLYSQAEYALTMAVENLKSTCQALIVLTQENLRKIVEVRNIEKTAEIIAYESGFFFKGLETILVLRNSYYSFISQLLKLIGLGLLERNSNLLPILEIIEESIPMYERHAESTYFNPRSPPEIARPLRKPDFELRNHCALLSRFNTQVSSLWMESLDLERFLEEWDSSSYTDFFEERMRVIDKLMLSCATTFKELSLVCSVKKKIETNERTLEDSENLKKEDPRIVISVGRSDFSVADEDQVFVNLQDKDEGEMDLHIDNEDVEEEGPRYPPGLVHELKGALELKKEEFNMRELEALKRQFPAVSIEVLCPPQENLPGEVRKDRPRSGARKVFDDESIFVPNSLAMESQKNISTSVAAICKNRFVEAETFSYSEESDCD